MSSTDWRTVVSGAWGRAENITVTEARAAVLALRREARLGHAWHSAHLFLMDNMGAVLSLERCRAKDFALLTVVRQWCGLCLACNIL
eukprot:9742193-Alexandrium_andersonii.AAC.1